MSVTLSDSDLRQLEAALHLFLSPLEYERVTEWRRACRKTVEQLIGADRSTFALFCMDGEPFGEQDHDLDSAIAAYLAYYHQLDLGFRERLTLLRLLLPAFKAGIHTCRALARHRDRWGRLLDDLGYAALVADGRGAVHRTPALESLLREDPEREAVDRGILCMVGSLAGLARRRAIESSGFAPDAPARDLTTARWCYRLRGSCLTTDLHGSVIIVLVSRLGSVLPTDPELRARFGLTVREAEVARLLANGSTNSMLARSLGISPHTAERHTERVLAKLGLHSRSAIAATLMDARLLSSSASRMPARLLP